MRIARIHRGKWILVIFMRCQDLFTGGRIRHFHESFRLMLAAAIQNHLKSVFTSANILVRFDHWEEKSSSSATFKVNRIGLVIYFIGGQQEKRVCSLASCIILYAVQTRVSSSLSTIRETKKKQQTDHTSSLESIAFVTQACMRINREYIHTPVANSIWLRRRLVSLLRACACEKRFAAVCCQQPLRI